MKNCNFEAGKLRADVQFKFNLSPDWYACSSPCINGPLLGRTVCGTRRGEKGKSNFIRRWARKKRSLIYTYTRPACSSHPERRRMMGLRGKPRTCRYLLYVSDTKIIIHFSLSTVSLEIMIKFYRKFWARRSSGKLCSCYFACAADDGGGEWNI